MLTIHLLGKPRIEREGEDVAPKGRKAWGLLAYLLCAGAATAREHLASLLFADADDPLGALRWNLAELRRCLGLTNVLKGDLLSLELPPGSVVDVKVLPAGTWAEGIELPGLGRDLLAGMAYPTSAAFEAWLLNERRHYRAASEATLREAALALLGAGQADRAIDVATRLVAVEPLVEEYQSLLIRSYAAAGDRVGAARQLAACTELFRRELGVEPGEIVTNATAISEGSTTTMPSMGSVAARAQLEAGRAAVDAGALDAGLECFRRAAAEAHTLGDSALKAEALFAMGAALVHSGRIALQEEGSAALHEVMSLCERTGQRVIGAGARREVAWREFLAGRYARAEFWLNEAGALAEDDLGELAAIHSVFGICKSNTAFYPEAIAHYERSVEFAESAGDEKRIAFSLTWLAKTHLLRDDLEAAGPAAERAVEIVKSLRWIGFQAMAESALGEAQLQQGNHDQAFEILEHAFGISLMLRDACYECAAERGLGLIEQRRGNVDQAVERFDAARMRLVERPDYMYLHAQALESLCAAAIARGDERVRGWVTDLESMTARMGMRELLARAYLHKASLGDDGAYDAATALAAEIDNRALHDDLASRRTAPVR